MVLVREFLHWLPLRDEIKIQKCCVIFNRVIGQSTSYMEQILVRNVDHGSRTNRHSNLNLICPRYKRETEGGKSFGVTGVKLWNSIPIDIRSNNSYYPFKKALRKYFFRTI